MKKHKNVKVQGSIILSQWCNDDVTASEHFGWEINPDKYYEVSWPDLVSVPRYNCDCTILGEVAEMQ